MSFLAPLFLLGALAVALPVVFHLARRTTRERKLFSALMFLRPAPPRLTRRNRLEHILLLVLRGVIICLLAAGFARPFLKRAAPLPTVGRVPTRTVILVDSSASMRREGLWSAARAKAEAAVREAALQDSLALFTFDRGLTPVVSFEEWHSTPFSERAALAISRLRNISPGWGATCLDHALTQAAEMLLHEREPKVDAQRVLLISDLQAGSRTSALRGYEWPRQIALVTEPVVAKTPGNASLHWLVESGLGVSGGETNVRVRLSNEADSKQSQFLVGWADSKGEWIAPAIETHLQGGQSRVVTLPRPPWSSNAASLMLRGDNEPFDNTLFVAPREAAHVKVLYLGEDAESDSARPLFFLRRALQPMPHLALEVVSARPAESWPRDHLREAALIVLTGALSEDQAESVRMEVGRGKTVLFALMNTAAAPTLARLLGRPELRLEEARPAGYALLGEMDFQHPLLAPFADARFNNFTSIHFWSYRRLMMSDLPEARLVARFDQGDPAIVEVPIGQGRLLLLTAGWHTADSQLALSTKFVPFLFSVLELGGALHPAPVQCRVGDVVSLSSLGLPTNQLVAVVRPDGTRATLAAGATALEDTPVPGVYRLTAGSHTAFLAVNLDATESRTAPLAPDEWARLVPPPAGSTPKTPIPTTAPRHLKYAEIEQNQKLWRWFIVAALGVLLVETWLAGHHTRRLAAPTHAPL